MEQEQTKETRRILNEFLHLLMVRDLKVANLVAETTDWYIQGNQSVAPWLGQRSSREEVREFFRLLWANTEPVSARIDHIVIERDTAVVTGDFATTMSSTGKVVNSQFCIVMQVRNGRIVKYRLFEDSYAVSKAIVGDQYNGT